MTEINFFVGRTTGTGSKSPKATEGEFWRFALELPFATMLRGEIRGKGPCPLAQSFDQTVMGRRLPPPFIGGFSDFRIRGLRLARHPPGPPLRQMPLKYVADRIPIPSRIPRIAQAPNLKNSRFCNTPAISRSHQGPQYPGHFFNFCLQKFCAKTWVSQKPGSRFLVLTPCRPRPIWASEGHAVSK